jgi:septin 2
MQDLQEVTHEHHYENYRSEKLGHQYKRRETKDTNGHGDIMLIDKDKMLKEKEEELRRMQEMVAKMQAQMMQVQMSEQNKTLINGSI